MGGDTLKVVARRPPARSAVWRGPPWAADGPAWMTGEGTLVAGDRPACRQTSRAAGDFVRGPAGFHRCDIGDAIYAGRNDRLTDRPGNEILVYGAEPSAAIWRQAGAICRPSRSRLSLVPTRPRPSTATVCTSPRTTGHAARRSKWRVGGGRRCPYDPSFPGMKAMTCQTRWRNWPLVPGAGALMTTQNGIGVEVCRRALRGRR